MPLTPSSFGLDLSNREIATLIYVVVLLGALAVWEKGRPHMLGLVRTFFAPALTQIWLLMSFYVAICVWFLAWISLWEWPNLKSTLLWWLTVGFTCIHEAQRLKDEPRMLRNLLSEAFTLSVVILFIAELVSFSLWVELLMLPSLVSLSLLVAVSEYQKDKPGVPRVLRLLRVLEVLAGSLVLGISFWLVASNVDEFWSLNTLREFGLPLLLWLLFVPFIFLLGVYMTYAEAFVQLQTRPKQGAIVRYARWRALFAFGWNFDAMKRLARDVRVRGICDKHGVKEAIREVKRLLKKEKNPPTVSRNEGWSPHEARRFLEEFGLVTDDYHRTEWEWCAQTPPVKLDDKMMADRISYYFSGNENSVTHLRLRLDGSDANHTQGAARTFDERALALLAKAFDPEQAATIYAGAQAAEPEALVIDDMRVLLDRSDWGNSRLGWYVRKLSIWHPRHEGTR